MKIHKKICILLVLLLVCACLLFSVTGCAPKMHEEGNFTYFIKKTDNGGTYVVISELTELGKQQKNLVIPEEIDGIKVGAIEKWKLSMWDANLIWESESLEKILFYTSKINIDFQTYENCANLKKVIVIKFDESDATGGGGIPNAFRKFNIFVLKQVYENLVNNFNYYRGIAIANITYSYNYEIDDNYGVYWIDDVDYGGVIEYIPQDPIREGYEFGGWYKEAECINKWNFEIDTLPQEQVDEEENTVYQETKLYANWMKK